MVILRSHCISGIMRNLSYILTFPNTQSSGIPTFIRYHYLNRCWIREMSSDRGITKNIKLHKIKYARKKNVAKKYITECSNLMMLLCFRQNSSISHGFDLGLAMTLHHLMYITTPVRLPTTPFGVKHMTH